MRAIHGGAGYKTIRIPQSVDSSFDILILGAGLVGSSLACALEARGLRVGLVEASAPTSGSPGFDERKLALSAASLNALQALGVLAKLPTAPAPIRRIHVSRVGDFGGVRLNAEDYGRDAFGGVVLARELGQGLSALLEELRNLTRFCPARVVSVASDAKLPEIEIEYEGRRQILSSKLLVAADGTRSLARQAFGIGVDEHDYRQHLFVCTVQTDSAPDGTAFERFSAQGPVALLPMSGGHYGALCGVASDDVERIAALNDAAYGEYFQQRFGWRAGRIRRVGARTHYPLIRVVADRLTAPRFVVMGNAAQTIHPIGAQGFNLGLRDALTLAECLGDVVDPGDARVLDAYVDARDDDRRETLAFSDGLARLTANESFPMRTLRAFGFGLLDGVSGLRAPLVSGAMGFRGRVPKLARGAP
jgi:2-octaprenyl-6-methoxyphenol hydroxylase